MKDKSNNKCTNTFPKAEPLQIAEFITSPVKYKDNTSFVRYNKTGMLYIRDIQEIRNTEYGSEILLNNDQLLRINLNIEEIVLSTIRTDRWDESDGK